MAPALRELVAEDGGRYHQFLEAGARAHPDTLRFSPLDLASRPFDTATTATRVTLLAEEPDRWCGVGTLERESGRTKRAHIAWVVRMVVAVPNLGIGRTILRALIVRGRQWPGVEKLNLTVASHNASAIRLYTSEGFSQFSSEPDAFRVDGRRVTELSMSLALK